MVTVRKPILNEPVGQHQNERAGQNSNRLAEQKIMLSVSKSLDASSYFQQAVQEGAKLALLQPDELELLQYRIVQLLAASCNRYTSGYSSSVTLETGQRIQQSVFYTIGFYLKKLPDTEAALTQLKAYYLEELYEKGRKLLAEEFSASKELLSAFHPKPLFCEILAYSDTIKTGLPAFFASYDIDYGAHECPGSIDYPLSNDPMVLTGLEYITDYLKKLQLEDLFCSYYPEEEIRALLRGSDPMYREQLFNIFDLVLANSIASVLLFRNGLNLNISDYDRKFLQYSLSSYSREQVEEAIDMAANRLCEELNLESSKGNHCSERFLRLSEKNFDEERLLKPLESNEFINYMKKSLHKLKGRLFHALETESLHLLFPSFKDEDDDQVILFKEKELLENKQFRALSEEIRDCRHASDKLLMLKEADLSATDLADLLGSDCFFDDEYELVFRSLEDIHLALLLKMLTPQSPDSVLSDSGLIDSMLSDSIRSDSVLSDSIRSDSVPSHYESTSEWQLRFLNFLNGIESEKRSRIVTFSKRLNVVQTLPM